MSRLMSESKEDTWLLAKMGKPWKRGCARKITLLCYFFLDDSLLVYRGVIERDSVAIPCIHTAWNLEISLHFRATSAGIRGPHFVLSTAVFQTR